MKKVTVLFSLSLISAAYLSLTGCQIVASPMAGGIYNETKYGDVATTHNSATKEGKACGTSILGWVATGDASVSAAKAAGGNHHGGVGRSLGEEHPRHPWRMVHDR